MKCVVNTSEVFLKKSPLTLYTPSRHEDIEIDKLSQPNTPGVAGGEVFISHLVFS